MKKFVAILIAVAMCVMIFAACSSETPAASESASESAQASESATPEESASPEETAAAGSLDAIKEAGKLVMLTNAAFPPYEYLGSDNKPAGVDVDMAQAIADEIGVELEVVDMDFDGLIPALIGGKGDMIAAGLTVTDERKESVDFSDTYADATQLIIVAADNEDITGVDDLNGKIIGVQLGTTGDIYASDIEGAEVSQYKTGLEAAMDLMNGKLDAVILDQLPAQNIVASNEEQLKLIDEPFTDEQYAIAVKKGDTDFLAVVNSVIAKLQDEGKVAEWTASHAEAAAVVE
jgi:polar amino acid transport system substrate-binding protein